MSEGRTHMNTTIVIRHHWYSYHTISIQPIKTAKIKTNKISSVARVLINKGCKIICRLVCFWQQFHSPTRAAKKGLRRVRDSLLSFKSKSQRWRFEIYSLIRSIIINFKGTRLKSTFLFSQFYERCHHRHIYAYIYRKARYRYRHSSTRVCILPMKSINSYILLGAIDNQRKISPNPMNTRFAKT